MDQDQRFARARLWTCQRCGLQRTKSGVLPQRPAYGILVQRTSFAQRRAHRLAEAACIGAGQCEVGRIIRRGESFQAGFGSDPQSSTSASAPASLRPRRRAGASSAACARFADPVEGDIRTARRSAGSGGRHCRDGVRPSPRHRRLQPCSQRRCPPRPAAPPAAAFVCTMRTLWAAGGPPPGAAKGHHERHGLRPCIASPKQQLRRAFRLGQRGEGGGAELSYVEIQEASDFVPRTLHP